MWQLLRIECSVKKKVKKLCVQYVIPVLHKPNQNNSLFRDNKTKYQNSDIFSNTWMLGNFYFSLVILRFFQSFYGKGITFVI